MAAGGFIIVKNCKIGYVILELLALLEK